MRIVPPSMATDTTKRYYPLGVVSADSMGYPKDICVGSYQYLLGKWMIMVLKASLFVDANPTDSPVPLVEVQH